MYFTLRFSMFLKIWILRKLRFLVIHKLREIGYILEYVSTRSSLTTDIAHYDLIQI